MPTPERIKLASLEKRRRVCAVCGAKFLVRSVDRVGLTCSPPCLKKRMAESASKRRASPETRAKMSAAAKAWYSDPAKKAGWHEATAAATKRWHADPENAAAFAKRSSERMKRRHHEDTEFQERRNERSSRVMKANWEKHRDLFTRQSAERYQAMLEAGTGLLSDEAKARKVEANKWILKQATGALHTETDYNEVYAEVQARLRREQPFSPGEDYYEYCKWLGNAVVMSPECRQIADAFLGEAIPRFAKEWNARKAQ